MFDFIKNMFKTPEHRQRDTADDASQIDSMDVVENNDIEVLKTSEFSEGKPAEVLVEFVEETEVPPPPQLELAGAEEELPAAQLDEPTDEPAPEELEPAEPDNYLTGDLNAARTLRAIQTREAGVEHWNSSTAKYRVRQKRGAVVDGNNVKNFQYFEALQSDPTLRQMELDNPGMSMDSLSLNKFMSDVSKEKMIEDYIEHSMDAIRDQQESGKAPLPTLARQRFGTGAGCGVSSDAEHKLRDLFTAFEIKQAAANDVRMPRASDTIIDTIDELLSEEEEAVREETYTRWLMTVAEEATESDDVLWLLVQDPNPDVRFCLAENYDINPEILRALSEDENPYVANRAQKTIMRMRSPGVVVDHDFSSAVFQQRKSG
ncbi:MAG TPA: hypothetical protein V6C76_12555 [Drouetiella sp.]